MEAKPIFLLYVPCDLPIENIVNITNGLENSMPDWHVLVINQGSEYKSKVIYRKPSFWGWWYNLWNM